MKIELFLCLTTLSDLVTAEYNFLGCFTFDDISENRRPVHNFLLLYIDCYFNLDNEFFNFHQLDSS